MKYVYLFLPAIGWGLMPLVIASVKNSTVYNQIVGTVAASFIFGAIVMAIMHPAMSWSLFLLSALGGACWVIGQVGQYISYEKIGVSETMPISTAKIMQKEIPNSRLVTTPDGGHHHMVDNPDVYYKHLADFIREVEDGSFKGE